MKQINIGLLGCGQVGSALIKLIQHQGSFIENKTGLKLIVKCVMVRDPKKDRPVKVTNLTTNLTDIINDREINLVVELIGGLEPARSYIIKSLQAGKPVVTANKAVLAHYGREINSVVRKTGQPIFYEAAVCAGVPIIRAIKNGLLANRIKVLMGILNGTTNYILTKMTEENLSFETALAEAQKAGFAEADPTLDLNGVDTAHKLNILASLAWGINIKPANIYKEGITGITPEDIKNAREFGYVIKLLAIGREVEGNKVELKVHPTMIPIVHPLASVRNEFNAVYLYGDAVGEIMFYGKGAGPLPTASAVLSDIIEAASQNYFQQVNSITTWGRKIILPIGKTVSKHYLRLPIVDKPGVIGKIATVLGVHKISIYGATASLVADKKGVGHVRILTKKTSDEKIRHALGEINTLPIMRGKAVMIRIEE